MFNQEETKSIITALRFYQAVGIGSDQMLDNAGIDAICERLKSMPEKLRLVVHLEGGLVQAVIAERKPEMPIEVFVLDYDVEGGDEDGKVGVTQDDGHVSEAYVSCHVAHANAGITLSDVFGETVATPTVR